MQTILKTLSLSALSATLFTATVNAQEPAQPAQLSQEQLQKIAKSFHLYLKQGVAFKDEDALRIMATAKANNGKLALTSEEMIAQLKKWKETSIPSRFKKLFAVKFKAKEATAVALQKQLSEPENGGLKLELTPERMTEIVKIWEAQDKAKDKAQNPTTK